MSARLLQAGRPPRLAGDTGRGAVRDGPAAPAAWRPRTAGAALAAACSSEAAWFTAALLLIAAAGLLKLELPLHGDQALFLSYARDLGEGLGLYVDRWDVKPPGVFAVYWLAGRLFGFSDRGVHLLELAWMLATAAALLIGVRPYLRQRWLAAVAPVASLGVYYAHAAPHEQTQVEALAGLPALLCLLALLAASGPSARRPALAFAAGVAGGLATTFKVVFAPIFAALLLAATLAVLRGGALAGRAGERPGRALWAEAASRLWLPFVLGAALVWAAVLAVFAAHGTAGAMLWTVFAYPFEALASVEPGPLKRLLVSLRAFAFDFAPWLVFLPLAAAPLLRRRPAARDPGSPPSPRRPEPLLALAWTWLLAGLAVILVQRNSWWYYHFMLLAVPTGVLASVGVDRAVAWLRLRARLGRTATLALAGLLVLPAGGSLLAPLGDDATRLMPVLAGTAPVARFKEAYGDYRDAAEAAAFLRAQARPGPVQVFETPLIALLAGRRQATPIAGFIWGFLLPRQYAAEEAALLADPPPFVFVGMHFEERLQTLAPAFAAALARDYRVAWQSRFGRWYERIEVTSR